MILRVDPDVTTLIDYHHSPKRRAENGAQGAGSHKNGAHGRFLLPVPDGTVVSDRAGNVFADLVGTGTEMVIAQGGRGGLGNAALASSKRKAPGSRCSASPATSSRSSSSSRWSPTSAWSGSPVPASPA